MLRCGTVSLPSVVPWPDPPYFDSHSCGTYAAMSM